MFTIAGGVAIGIAAFCLGLVLFLWLTGVAARALDDWAGARYWRDEEAAQRFDAVVKAARDTGDMRPRIRALRRNGPSSRLGASAPRS
jgi:hypothetical protein